MNRKSTIHGRSAAQTWLLRAGTAGLVALTVYLVFEFGRIQANYNIVEAVDERQAYEDIIDELELEIETLKQEVALLETHRDIEREAYKEVEINLTELQAKIQEQTDAIAFYRGIVSPKDGAAGLRVQDLELTRTATERAFNVRLVLVQSMVHDRKVSGDVNFTVQGLKDGEAASIPYSDLLAEDADGQWAFSFRYFQDFNREIVLPDGFEPESIHIEVRSRTRSIDSIEESYSWVTSPG